MDTSQLHMPKLRSVKKLGDTAHTLLDMKQAVPCPGSRIKSTRDTAPPYLWRLGHSAGGAEAAERLAQGLGPPGQAGHQDAL